MKETQLKELDIVKIAQYGKLKEVCKQSEIDDGSTFINKEKSRVIFEKFKIRR